MSTSKILVLGATGTQGGAVCRHLSSRGDTRILAISRDPETDKARKVASLPGVELLPCDADNPGQLEATFSAHGPLDGVYSVQINDYTEDGAAREISQGKRVVDLCASHTVGHLVYSSVMELHPPDLPDVVTKVEIEAHLSASKVPFTILRPAFFIENFFENGFAEASASEVGYPGFDSKNQVEQKYIYIDDLGMIAAQIFADSKPWLGKTLELAGDSLTPAELVDVFANHNGRAMSARELPVDAFGPAVMPLFAGLRDGLWQNADIDGLREQFPRLHTVKGALEHKGYRPPDDA